MPSPGPSRGRLAAPRPSRAPPPPCAGGIVVGPGAPDVRNRGSRAAPAGRQDGGDPSNRGRAVTRSQRGMPLPCRPPAPWTARRRRRPGSVSPRAPADGGQHGPARVPGPGSLRRGTAQNFWQGWLGGNRTPPRDLAVAWGGAGANPASPRERRGRQRAEERPRARNARAWRGVRRAPVAAKHVPAFRGVGAIGVPDHDGWASATDERRSRAGCIAARMQRGLSPRAAAATIPGLSRRGEST